ncbi:NF038120 family PEP-CTERM protein [Rugamonas sp.]|uniref:NF038120 family PEP-CTERM protein n=1 Tax=Rugamonas sp. TaxID=1926287 RepID=UPI0025F0A6BF|nr:NF038120 family PEP-CTERM protein [Rugamonas sp.]
MADAAPGPAHAGKRAPTALTQLLGGTALLLAAALPLAAGAATIDFDSLDPTIVFDQDTLVQNGMLLTGIGSNGGYAGAVVDGAAGDGLCSAMACPKGDNSHYYAALNDGALTINAVAGGQLIALRSFDAAFIGGDAGASYPLQAGLLTVVGVRADGTKMQEQFGLAAQADGSLRFGSYLSQSPFAGQGFASLSFSGVACSQGQCSALGDNSGQFALDNLTISAVPEPSAWLFLSAGLGLLAMLARRRPAA